MTLSIMTFQTKTWLMRPQLETGFMCPVMKNSDSYWIYANEHIAMEKIITCSLRVSKFQRDQVGRKIYMPQYRLWKYNLQNCFKKVFLCLKNKRLKINNIFQQSYRSYNYLQFIMSHNEFLSTLIICKHPYESSYFIELQQSSLSSKVWSKNPLSEVCSPRQVRVLSMNPSKDNILQMY